MNKKRLLSGLQPSGELTLGNYCGSIKQFLEYQKEYDAIHKTLDENKNSFLSKLKEVSKCKDCEKELIRVFGNSYNEKN